MRATGTNWRIDGAGARGEEMVFGGGAGIRSVGGNVHLEVAGGLAADLVGVGCLAGGERGAAPRHAEDTGMASG